MEVNINAGHRIRIRAKVSHQVQSEYMVTLRVRLSFQY